MIGAKDEEAKDDHEKRVEQALQKLDESDRQVGENVRREVVFEDQNKMHKERRPRG